MRDRYKQRANNTSTLRGETMEEETILKEDWLLSKATSLHTEDSTAYPEDLLLNSEDEFPSTQIQHPCPIHPTRVVLSEAPPKIKTCEIMIHEHFSFLKHDKLESICVRYLLIQLDSHGVDLHHLSEIMINERLLFWYLTKQLDSS